MNLSWTSLTNSQVLGYYDSVPASDMITGYGIYYRYETYPSTPSTYARSSWTLAPTNGTVTFGVAGTHDPGSKTGVVIPAPGAGQTAYVALCPLFDGASAPDSFRESYFVGHESIAIGPTPAGVFASFNASINRNDITATWRSNVETGVAQYQVYASAYEFGPFEAVAGTETAPTGNNHEYTVTFKVPKSLKVADKIFLKVKDSDFDGGVFWSNVVGLERRPAQPPSSPEMGPKAPAPRIKTNR